MDKRQLLKKAFNVLLVINRRKLTKASNAEYFKMLRESDIEIKRLSDEQKKMVDEIYGKYGFRYSYDTHELVYSVTGNFYPDVVPVEMFRTDIEIYLNDYDTKFVLSDKNYFDIFMSEVKFAEAIVRNIKLC